jgi:hypothetical protein
VFFYFCFSSLCINSIINDCITSSLYIMGRCVCIKIVVGRRNGNTNIIITIHMKGGL